MKIIPISFKAAREFVDLHHRHNRAPAGNKFCLGLELEHDLIGVAIAGRPVSRHLDDGLTLEITRVCVIEGYPNACSKLYARMVKIARLMGYTSVITYTLDKESQSSLKAIGARIVDEIKPREWTRPKRKRESQPVYSEPKIRWELTR